MTNTLNKTPGEISMHKGRNIVAILVSIFILIEILILGLKILERHPVTLWSALRILITIVVIIGLYRGQGWAKLVLGISSIGAVPFGVYAVFQTREKPLLLALFLFLTVFYMLAAYILLRSSAVAEYLKSLKK